MALIGVYYFTGSKNDPVDTVYSLQTTQQNTRLNNIQRHRNERRSDEEDINQLSRSVLTRFSLSVLLPTLH